jgi:hypothetical protein
MKNDYLKGKIDEYSLKEYLESIVLGRMVM